MGTKPSDFSIGIGELIGVLLPGAVVAFAATPLLQKIAQTYSLAPLTGTAGWVGFTLLAYFVGHLVFLFGSFLDRPYDYVRERLWPREQDAAYNAVTTIRERVLGTTASTTNTYKFATALLALRHEAAHAEVRQLEADSKFFRSLTVLAVVLLIASAAIGEGFAALGFVGIAVLCCWRYIERRWKATQRAFEYVVVLNGLGFEAPPNQALHPTPARQ